MKTLLERFESRYIPEPNSGCWIWIGTVDNNGYGEIIVDGKLQRATHVSWSLYHGVEFPAEMDACHSCDFKPCVNPQHISPGTRRENVRQAIDRGLFSPLKQELAGQFNRLKTHCKRGHEFNEANTFVHVSSKYTMRACRTCSAVVAAAYYATRGKARRAARPFNKD